MDKTAREKLTTWSERLYHRRLTFSAGGNVSLRLKDGSVLITPSGRCKGTLRPEDLVKVSVDGDVIGNGHPSIETDMHLALYQARDDIGSVVHCHPLYCTALAVMREPLRPRLTPEGVLLLGDVPMVPYYPPGSIELVGAVASHCGHNAMIMERHGALTVGRDLEQAYNRMEEMEFQARLQLIVGDRGQDLDETEVARILG